jgi:hypothetical protein
MAWNGERIYAIVPEVSMRKGSYMHAHCLGVTYTDATDVEED